MERTDMRFLPINREDMGSLGWDRPDFVYVTGDAYVDHPSFGVSIISRVLEDAGYRVAILSQPEYRSCDAFREFGRPRLGFLVTAGNIDSMVAHYTVSKKKRTYDYYSPGGKAGLRPDYVEAVDAETLVPVKMLAKGKVVLLAAYAGKTRLIDNIIL